MHKYSIFLGLLAVLVVGLVAVSFSVMGNPFDQKLKAKDEAILSDFYNISSSVSNYYSSGGKLPPTLSVLAGQYTPYGVTDLSKLASQYEYQISSPISYRLCSTFATDTQKKSPQDSNALSLYGTNYAHPKGHACVSFDVPTYLVTPTPTRSPSPTPTIPPATITPVVVY